MKKRSNSVVVPTSGIMLRNAQDYGSRHTFSRDSKEQNISPRGMRDEYVMFTDQNHLKLIGNANIFC